jgi:hypothetical protein
MPPYHHGRKIDYDDDTIIVLEAMLRIIKSILQDMEVGNIS